ncbi:MAG TPA: hypothetical protein DCP07_02405 [Lachnospiraceae bacterium]|nr:hypothetical protein [Lachnospiraceae bacterium]
MKYLEELKEAVKKEDFGQTFLILEKIKNEENPMDYFEDLFMFMENNPNIDYGMPGPIVHFMESYYKKGYEDELLKSVKRKPTQHTVWMLNRVLNDVNLIGREKYIGVMEESIKRTDVDLETKKEIKGFLEFQNIK